MKFEIRWKSKFDEIWNTFEICWNSKFEIGFIYYAKTAMKFQNCNEITMKLKLNFNEIAIRLQEKYCMKFWLKCVWNFDWDAYEILIEIHMKFRLKYLWRCAWNDKNSSDIESHKKLRNFNKAFKNCWNIASYEIAVTFQYSRSWIFLNLVLYVFAKKTPFFEDFGVSNCLLL